MKFLRDPLIHFLVLGAGLFLLFAVVGEPAEDSPDRIEVTSAKIRHLIEGWSRTWQRPPTQQELDGLIEDYIKEEVLYREALAMGLDRDDMIVRRRMRQKVEFIAEDLVAAVEPTDEDLQTYLEQEPDAFRIPGKMSFDQVYLSHDRRGEAIDDDAKRALSRLNGGADPSSLGDPLPLPPTFESISAPEVSRLFGGDLGTRLMDLPTDRWSGPLESGYGLHLVLVRDRTEARQPSLDEVRREVRRELQFARRREANEAFYQRLRERYEVIVEPPSPADEDGESVAQVK